jgi:exonuclease SbcC
MKIDTLEINNILSIKEALITFGDSGLVLVEGKDYDTGRANGAGKSAIFNALSFALYDKIPRRITKSEIIRKGEKRGYAIAQIHTNAGRYGVKRERPNVVTFYKDDKVIDITQEEFEDRIGLNYDQFLITMYTAQDSSDRFIELNDTGKKDFILKIMNLDKFTKCKQEVSDKIKALNSKKQLVETKINGLKSNISIYKNSMVDIDDINIKIEQNEKDIKAYTKAIKELEDIKEPDFSKYAETEKKVQDKLMNLQSMKMLCNAKRNELAQLKDKTPDAECPECTTSLNIVNGQIVKSSDQDIIQEQIKAVTTQINEYETDIAKEQEIKELAKKIQIKKQEEYSDYNSARSSISEYRSSINIKQSGNENLKQQLTKNDEIKDKVTDILNQAKILKTDMDKAKSELLVLEAVSSVFDSTGAPAYVMDAMIDSFNTAISDYISEIWPDATYVLQTYKQNKDKTVKAKFSESLTINGKERSIGSLSGGELRALSLALDFAIIDTLSTKYGLSLNPVILDEPFNGLDSVGRELVIDLLTKFSTNRQIWVVDHASEAKAMFNQVLRVEKRNGVSNIVQSVV